MKPATQIERAEDAARLVAILATAAAFFAGWTADRLGARAVGDVLAPVALALAVAVIFAPPLVAPRLARAVARRRRRAMRARLARAARVSSTLWNG